MLAAGAGFLWWWEAPGTAADPGDSVAIAARDEPEEQETALAPAAENPDASPVYGPFLPPEQQRRHAVLHVGPGDTLTGLLAAAGFAAAEIQGLLRAVSSEADPDRVPLGARMDLTSDGGGRILEFIYEPQALDQVWGIRGEALWRVWSEKVPLEVREAALAGSVEESLFASVQALSEGPELAVAIASLFAWQVDFAKETRSGDGFRVVVEKRYRDGKFWDYGPIAAAQYRYSGGTREAYCIPVGEQGRKCYDAEGRSLHRSFLRAPLAYSRVSSKFTHRRFHPVLGIFRPHEGVDYAAPTGTPVWSVAEGRAAFVGRRGGNGNMVIVSHPGGIQTYYNHLSRFARGLRRGSPVRQKQVIGYVGSTGLSTGPHLDFRIKKGKRFVDPLKADLPPGSPVPKDLRAQFGAYRDRMRERLESADAIAQAPPAKEKPGG